jgi:hypothetical protein
MVLAGLPPAAALRAGTLNGARALGMEGDIGSIAPGKWADLFVVRWARLHRWWVMDISWTGTGADPERPGPAVGSRRRMRRRRRAWVTLEHPRTGPRTCPSWRAGTPGAPGSEPARGGRVDPDEARARVVGVRVISLLLQGPPADGEAPAMWFFRRTDTPFPEIRSLATARKVRCPEGKEPHTQVERAELAEYLAEAGVEGVFVLYDQGARRIVRVNPGADGGLPLGSGTARTTAWNQVARLVDEGGGANADTPLAERGGDAGAGTAWIAGRERTPGGALFGWALHLSRAPAGWVAEGEEAEALEALARRLVEGVLGEGGG